MSCTSSKNVICKHVRAEKTFYVDLDNQLPSGVTIESVTASSEDEALEITEASVVTETETITSDDGCVTTLVADRAVLVRVTGGTPSDDETTVTIEWEQSDGDSDARDLRLIITGEE